MSQEDAAAVPAQPGSRKYLLFLGPEDRPPRKRYVTASFRVPRWLSEKAHAMARAEDLSFSQFMRRGIKRELAAAGIPVIPQRSSATMDPEFISALQSRKAVEGLQLLAMQEGAHLRDSFASYQRAVNGGSLDGR